MKQNGNYTGKNNKSRKDQYSKIQRNNKNQKDYNYSKTKSEGTISNIPNNKSQYTSHQFQNNKYEQIKIIQSIRTKKCIVQKTYNKITISTKPVQYHTTIKVQDILNLQPNLTTQKGPLLQS